VYQENAVGIFHLTYSRTCRTAEVEVLITHDDICWSAWVGFSSPSVCLFVRSITKKRMIPKLSNLVYGMILGYTRSDVFGVERSKVKSQGQYVHFSH